MLEIKDAGLRFNDNYAVRDGDPIGVILHHSAIEGEADIVAIHNYHQNVNGWAGIGYHFYVTKDGEIWRGRPENWYGAHTVGFNDRIGICAEGNFDTEDMPEAQKKAIVQLIAYLQEKYGALEITRHRDHDATACPGAKYPFEDIVAGVAQAKEEVQDGTGNPSPTQGGQKEKQEGLILRFQRAAMADGLALPQYGDDGLWGLETATAASELVLYGSTGERVKLIQEIVGADVDGIFGDETQGAVKAFQAKNGLDVDGVVGIETWKALLEVVV